MLNSTNRRNLCVKQFADGIDSSDADIEANLSTVLQSVRGTKQFWFLKKSDIMAMIREFGSPTLFLTFSCAEYDSPDIDRYLQKVNKVPDSYPTTRLCIEDPRSVSRKSHTSWKKEYQSRGAPHYHSSPGVLHIIMFSSGLKMHQLLELILNTQSLHGLKIQLLAIF